MRQFSKRYSINADVNLDAITSRRTPDGVLQIALPKAGKRNIHVAVAEGPALPAASAAPSLEGPKAAMEEVTVEVEKEL